jgi:5-methyltetrahydropteroyltriglutamate--homocysteine methyltransferase
MGIATTHTGSLPRPADITALLIELQEGSTPVGLDETADRAVTDIVSMQVDVGLDIVNDGEQSKTGYSTYVQERLSGFGGVPVSRPRANDLKDYPDFAEMSVRLRGRPSPALPPCNGPIELVDAEAVHRDIARLKAAAAASGIGPDRLFMSAASPGLVAMFFGNEYYATREEFLGAIADAMRPEYEAIVNAGITLQLDCPDFAMSHNSVFQDLSVEEFRREVALSIEAVNHATSALAPEAMRLHVCWGNYESPHTTDVPLADLIDLISTVRPAGISVEGANPRHEYEWEVFESFDLPGEKYLIPGVIDSTSNFVEHPRLIAQRLRRYIDVLGVERVMAGTDCGFDTFIGRDRVSASVVWAKLRAAVEGARLATA